MDYDPLKLENQLCFPLYACAKEVVKRYKPLLDEVDLTYTQYITMMVMWERRELTVKQLGDELLLDSGTLTPLLKKLESKGFISRNRSKIDERAVVLTLTKEGEALKDRCKDIPNCVSKSIPLEPQDAADLYRITHRLLDMLQEEEEAKE